MLVYEAGATLSRLFLPGAGANPIWSEPESAPGPWTSGTGAAQKSGGSATLVMVDMWKCDGDIYGRNV